MGLMPLKESQESWLPLPAPCQMGIQEVCTLQPQRGNSLEPQGAGTQILDFPAYRTIKNQSAVCKPPSLWYVL